MRSLAAPFCFGWLLVTAMFMSGYMTSAKGAEVSNRIQPYAANPSYWQYEKEPVLLLGGSSVDNIFQHASPGLDQELDRLTDNGGNYIRCVMTCRRGGDVEAFHRDSQSGMFDLGKWNDEYWRRLEYFLEATHRRDIIVQIEIWATYDFYTRPGTYLNGRSSWKRSPWNPANNINYSEEQSGLIETFRSSGWQLINPFFNTVLPLKQPFDFEIRPMVLGYQQRFVGKILSHCMAYDHVLYVIDNETNADPKWPLYWSQYIRSKAAKENEVVEITEMWDTFDPSDGEVEGVADSQSLSTHFFTLRSSIRNTLDDPDNYSYLDISNHNAQTGEVHYRTGLYVWNKVRESGILRPINNTKIYGNEKSWSGTPKDGMERFWRNVFAGAASVRFHRPASGLGNADTAMANIRSMRVLTDSIDLFSGRPANDLLSGREENEAYCLATRKGEYVLFFPSGGRVGLEVMPGKCNVQWLNVMSTNWLAPQVSRFPANLETPDKGLWAVKVVRE